MKFKQDLSELVLIPAGGGRFEVSVNGQVIYSKLATGSFPDPAEIVETVRRIKGA